MALFQQPVGLIRQRVPTASHAEKSSSYRQVIFGVRFFCVGFRLCSTFFCCDHRDFLPFRREHNWSLSHRCLWADPSR